MEFVINFFINGCVGTVVLAFALWLLSDDKSNPFKEFGSSAAWGRCAALSFGVGVLAAIGAAVSLSGIFALLTIVAWFGGIMVLFERTFIQALILTIAVWGVSFLIAMAIGAMLVGAYVSGSLGR